MKKQRGNPGIKGRLINKSMEAYILALETINRLSIQYRIEIFCFLICNAWELLLKAKIIQNKGDSKHIYRNQASGITLSLNECLNRIIPNKKDPTRRNIERIAQLRNEATHLIISQIPNEIMCLFQAGVINYHSCLNEWFKISLADRVPAGMMSIVYDLTPERSILKNSSLSRKMGGKTATFLLEYCSELEEEFNQLSRSSRFSIGIEYKLALTKKADDADIVLSSGSTGNTSANIVEVPKDPSRTHPLRQKEVIKLINNLGSELEVNQYDIQCVTRAHDIKNRPEYFYQGKIKGSPGQYSHSYVDWIIDRYQQDERFFEKAKIKAKNQARNRH